MAAAGCPCAVSAADTDRFVSDFVLRERLKIDNRLLDQETRRLEGAVQAGASAWVLAEGLGRIDRRLRSAAVQVFQEATQRLAADLSATAARLKGDNERLQTDWGSLRRSLWQQRRALEDVKISRRAAVRPDWLLSLDNRWFWIFGLVAAAALLALVLHDLRREIRCWLRGGPIPNGIVPLAIGLLLLMLTAAASTGLVRRGEGTPRPITMPGVKPGVGLAREVAVLEEVHRRRELEWRKAEDACREKFDGSKAESSGLAGAWMGFRQQVRAVAVELAILETLLPAVGADQAELCQVEQNLLTQREALATDWKLRRNLRSGLGAILVGLTALGGVSFWRDVGRRQREAFDRCPLCLGREALFEEAAPVSGDAEGPPGDPPRVVRCRNLVRQNPPEQCNYRFSAGYRPFPKLSFPTMGVPQAGKTHWLAMLYWTINRGNYPASIRLEKVRSQSSEDFDRIVEEVLRSRIGTAATQRDRIPHPVVLNCSDRDRWGRSHSVVNLFDYSGEVTLDLRADDHRRRRALEADGFLFFLDPTFPSGPQAQAMADFREDLRLLKGLRSSRRARTPIALCVSKIDLLPAQRYALPGGGDAIAKFYDDLRRIDPTGEACSRRVMEARSRLVSQLRETIWPGWDIERQMRDLFGGRYLFFPLTPVGLEGRSETDLSLRTISPFAILEPLMWLLHMNGYCILRD
jgi:hypothetical protein